MKPVIIYKDEVSGKTFGTIWEAEKSERKSKHLKKLFAFVKLEKDPGCKFANGGWAVQRTAEYHAQFKAALVLAIQKYEPKIVKEFKEKGYKLEDVIFASGWLGRYLSDSDSDIYGHLCDYGRICPKCYREWGQMYYTINCTHTNKTCASGL